MARSTTVRLIDPEPENPFQPTTVDLPVEEDSNVVIGPDGTANITHADGSITIDSNYQADKKSGDDEGKFFDNLAGRIDEAELARIASDLLTGIEMDIQSRKEWLDTRATGIKLLGLKLEEPRGDAGTSSAPLEGMSTIRHPLLLEAVIRFQANALGELLPAAGPVKVRNDLPVKPESAPPEMGHNGGPPLEGEALDELGGALEKDFNHYLTATATEYVPDTDRMMFYIGFGGDGFKKVYNCPLRRRPVSESVDAEDIIVSNAATDIRNCGRVTHRIKMRPSTLRRMQIAGEYRDVKLSPPDPSQQATPPEQAKAEIAGQKPQAQRPQDADYEVYECYCELDLPDFAPKQFKNKELPLPYVVTLEKVSKQVLAVRRNWEQDDPQALPKQFFVQFPYIRGLGFYGLGLIHILGNVTMALTAIWRIMIDNGMFSNFPGFLFAKGAGRQNTNQIRVPPGGGYPVDLPAGMDDIRKFIMGLPYKETGPSFTNLATHIEEVGQRLGQTADIGVGEGKQETPVGTIMAVIEQATKITDAVHKRLHAAQAQEFQLLKERFREDPEAFWRHNKRPARQWQVDEFRQALDQRELVPVSDPNNPTSLHRIAKAVIIDMLLSKYPLLMNAQAGLRRILRIADVDSEGLLNAQPAQPPPDPRMVAIQAKAQAEQMKAQIDQARVQLEAMKLKQQSADSQADREFKMQMQQFDMYLEQLRVKAEMIIHAHDIDRDDRQAKADMAAKHAETVHGIAMDHAQHQQDLSQQSAQHELDLTQEHARAGGAIHAERMKHQHKLLTERDKHEQSLQHDRDKHVQGLHHAREQHEADLEHKRALAKAAAAAKPKPSGDK